MSGLLRTVYNYVIDDKGESARYSDASEAYQGLGEESGREVFLKF